MVSSKIEQIKKGIKSRLLLQSTVEEDPRLLSDRTKNKIIIILALCACTPGFSSTIYFPGLPLITSDLNAPPIATTLTAALFVLFMGLAPVLWASISDHYHMRRYLSIISMLIFSVASLGSAVITNIWGLVVLRCIQSVGSSCGQSVGAGVIADCYPIEKRGVAFSKFFFGVFFGPLLGPIIGGVLIMSKERWRATFWFCLAFGLIDDKFDKVLPISKHTTMEEKVNDHHHQPSMSVSMDDENTMVPIQQQNLPQEEENNKTIVSNPTKQKKFRMNPFASFLLLRHPFVFLASFVGAVAFASMFAVETIIPGLYEENYQFSSWQTGLSYLGAGIGNLIGSTVGGKLSDRLMMRSRNLRGRPMTEDRLTFNLWPCNLIIMPFGLLLFGWMVEYQRSVWAGIIGFGFVTFGMSQVVSATSAYLVDAMPGKGASATAAANLVRMVLACILTLVSNQMVTALGPGFACVLLAGLSWLAAICLLILKIYGEQLRHWSGFRS
ncbi:unnamed protein product [Cunninghamella echinulata]